MAQSIGNNQPNSYRLISVVISNNEGNQIDVSNLVDSFSITESIYQMFLTGSITIVDNMNIFNRLNIAWSTDIWKEVTQEIASNQATNQSRCAKVLCI